MSDAFPHPKVLLARYGLTAKKSWGQNFLVSERAYRGIVDATVRREDDWVVEIGAGLGTLTMRLAERALEGKVIAVERDRDMIRVLEAELGNLDNVEIAEANALTYDLGTVARWCGDSIVVCGNLPYHISSQLLFRVLDARAVVRRAIVMIQREMADRILASPGTKQYGALGVMITTYFDASLVVRVGKGGFVPAPKVESAVIRLLPLENAGTRAPIDDEKLYSVVVHAAFEMRRKTLRNALRAKFGQERTAAALDSAGIDGIRRGETLSVAEFATLSNAIGAFAATGESDATDASTVDDAGDPEASGDPPVD